MQLSIVSLAEIALLQHSPACFEAVGRLEGEEGYNGIQQWQGSAQARIQRTWYAMSKKGKSCFSFISLEMSFHCSGVGSTPAAPG